MIRMRVYTWTESPGTPACRSELCLSVCRTREKSGDREYLQFQRRCRMQNDILIYISYSRNTEISYIGDPSNFVLSVVVCVNYTDTSPSSGPFQRFRVLFVPIRKRQNLKRSSIGNWESWRRSQQATRRRIKEHVGGALSRLLPWSHTLHKIEGDC